MKSRAVRLALALSFMLATIAAAWFLFTTAAAARAARASYVAVEADADAVALSIAELRASEQAYVAAGQGEAYWIARVGERLTSVRARLSALGARVRSDRARASLESAAARLDDFEEMDRRAREYARTGQRLLASDLIFADGLETTRAAGADVEAARLAEREATDARVGEIERRQALAAGGALAAGLLLVLLLAPTSTAPSAVAGPAEALSIAPAVSGETDAVGAALDAQLARLDRAPSRSSAASADLGRAAELCSDLARVHDPRELTLLLDRAAKVLDASGLILWMADPDRRELLPTLTHGYATAALARFGSIPKDADNATAAAFREATLKTVAADGATGAIVAPLVAQGGCVGVMAAEVQAGRERSETTRAFARIIAAQLATLFGAPPSAARATRTAQ